MSLGHFQSCFSRVGFIAKGSYLWTKQNASHILEGRANKFPDRDSYILKIVLASYTDSQKRVPAYSITFQSG